MDDKTHNLRRSGNANHGPKPTALHKFILMTFAFVALFFVCGAIGRGAYPFNHLTPFLNSTNLIEFGSTAIVCFLFVVFFPSATFVSRAPRSKGFPKRRAGRRRVRETGQDTPTSSSRDTSSSPSSSVGVQTGVSLAKLTTSGGALCTRPRATCDAIEAMRVKEQAEVDRLDDELWRVQIQVTSAILAKADAEKQAALAQKRADETISSAKKEADDRITRVVDDTEARLKLIQADADRKVAAACEKAESRLNEMGMKDRKIAELKEEISRLRAASTTHSPPTPTRNPANQPHTPPSAKRKSPPLEDLEDMATATKKMNCSTGPPPSFAAGPATPILPCTTTTTKLMFENAVASANKLTTPSLPAPAICLPNSAPARTSLLATIGHGKSFLDRIHVPAGPCACRSAMESGNDAVSNAKAGEPMDGFKEDWEDEDLDIEWEGIFRGVY
ncbi:hypothetical protein ACRALDRAFT_1071222 [Sodiomyces alcalophilus JCM 7366]|uniref:uncharacterized protein n=1 Tax=Sodiomyces alcalophilus JCM 7366 TaxID=591952 RepID=UPI0039B5D818